MTFRWYGRGNDTVTLEHVKQIPGVKGIVWGSPSKARRRRVGKRRNQSRD
nr:mannonate dehydratase [Bacillus subtilis]